MHCWTVSRSYPRPNRRPHQTGRVVVAFIDLAREKTSHRVSTAIACVHTESFVPDTTSAQPSDDSARVDALTAEVASLRDDNTTLRDELARAQTALANLRIRYYQLIEEL